MSHKPNSLIFSYVLISCCESNESHNSAVISHDKANLLKGKGAKLRI
jgi:hypothetical protein